jgi:DNA-binding CsgD family transcriptional regulator
MMQLSRNDLRRSAEFAHAALLVTDASDVHVLLRRFRTVVPCDGAVLHRIGTHGISAWADPEISTPVLARGRLSVSEAVAGELVHLSIWRRTSEFARADHRLVALMFPFLTMAVAAVGGHDLSVRSGAHDPARTGDLSSLTAREAQVLTLISDGATNKEVAQELRISPRTVQKHLEHIYDKLGLHRRTAAAGWWSDHLAG